MVLFLKLIPAGNLKISYVSLMKFICTYFMVSCATVSAYQPILPTIKNTDQARTDLIDKTATQGFTYTFKDKIYYKKKYNVYTVGQHCYRGGPIRFSVPVEHFFLSINNKVHKVIGKSIWNKYYIESRWNFILNWLDSGYWIVSLRGDACVDVILDTRYETEKLLRQSRDKQIPVTIRNTFGKIIGKFTLLLP